MKKDISYFIPNSVVAGKREDGPAFVTCRFKYDAWLSPSVFERLTGYKPTNQRDRAAQLKKAVTDAVAEIENVPTAGFKLIGWSKNPYGYAGSEYKFTHYAVLTDPRGFSFAIPGKTFISIPMATGGNMSGGVLAGKFAYAWTDNPSKAMTLVSENDSRYAEWKAASDKMAEKKKTEAFRSVSKRELVPGKVYRAAKVLAGDWMYVGVYDTYSYSCHMDAYDNGGKYDIDKFIDSEAGMLREKWTVKWPTTKGKMVFYSMTPQEQQYVIRSDISGIFSGEAPASPDVKMYNSEKLVTLENVLDDVSRNPGFQQIAFCEKRGFEHMPLDVFSFYFGRNRFKSFDAGMGFPFYWAKCLDLVNSGGKALKIRPNSEGIIWTVCDVLAYKRATYGRPSLIRSAHATLEDIYGKYQPLCEDLRFKNGNKVSPLFSAAFNPKDARDAARCVYF